MPTPKPGTSGARRAAYSVAGWLTISEVLVKRPWRWVSRMPWVMPWLKPKSSALMISRFSMRILDVSLAARLSPCDSGCCGHLDAQNLRVEGDQLVNFALVVAAFEDGLAPRAPHLLGERRVLQEVLDGAGERLRVARGNETAKFAIAEERPDGREVAADDRQAASPGLEDLHRDVVHEFGNGQERRHGNAGLRKRFGHFDVRNPAVQEDLRGQIHAADALQNRRAHRLIVGVTEKERACQNAAFPQQLQGVEQHERSGPLGQATAIDQVEALRYRLHFFEEFEIWQVVEDQFFAFAGVGQSAHGARVGGHEAV